MSDADIEKEVAAIVLGGDLEQLSIKAVRTQLGQKFGEDVINGKKDLVKRLVVDAVQAREAPKREREEEKAEDQDEIKEPAKEKSKNAKPKKKVKAKDDEPKPSSRKRERDAVPEREEPAKDIPTTVEVEMDVSDFLRRNPSRHGRAKTKAAPKPKKPRAKKEKDPNAPKRKVGFGKDKVLAPELAEFMGVPEASRPEVSKRITAYVKENKLQDPKDGRKIIFDETLKTALRAKQKTTTFFKLAQVLTPLLYEKGEVKEEEEEEDEDEEEVEDVEEEAKKEDGSVVLELKKDEEIKKE